MALNVALLGHSFIRRLRDFMDNSDYFFNLRLHWPFNIMSRAQGGLTISRLIHERLDLFSFRQDENIKIVYLQLGGNDLSNRELSARQVANEIYSFACFLHFGLEIPFVIIGELLFRDRKCDGPDYNSRVVETNCALLDMTRSDGNPNIIFWRHHGFWQDLSHLCWDRVHLNHLGMLKYFRSVRSAVMHAQLCLGKHSHIFIGCNVLY